MWRRPLQKSRRSLKLIKINLIQDPASNKILSYPLILRYPPLQNNSSTSCLQSWTMHKGLALSKPQCIHIPWCIRSSSQSVISDCSFFWLCWTLTVVSTWSESGSIGVGWCTREFYFTGGRWCTCLIWFNSGRSTTWTTLTPLQTEKTR